MKIIAESAFNHEGNLNYLKELAKASKNSGADYFTIQVMNVEAFCVEDYSKFELYTNTSLSAREWIVLFDYCEAINLEVIPCVLEEVSFELCYDYGFRLIKLHATDITNSPFLKQIKAKKDVRIILETQCATLFEVKFALSILGNECIEALFSGFSNYPTEVEDLNLNVLDYFKQEFDFKIGFADHSLDTTNIPLMLLAKGCHYLEKHITISRNHRRLDYQVSLYPTEFSAMTANIKHYSKALGSGVKHPVANEHPFRSIMYKKLVEGESTLKRANAGSYFLESEIASFAPTNAVVALIARLKSQRLKRKVLKPFHNNQLIVDLYDRLNTSSKFKTILATSNLTEDKPLANIFESHEMPVFKGDAISVIDRMLDLSFQEKAGSIFRVTGDNPFTDPKLMEEMLDLLVVHKLDYVKVNNVPFGVGPELFSTSYLWKLYLGMETTAYSEYLTWYVLKDQNVRAGSIDIESTKSFKLVNLSVDLQEDYDRCLTLLKAIETKQFKEISLNQIYEHLNVLDQVDDTKYIKLPEGEQVQLSAYLKSWENKDYIIRKTITL